MPRRKENAKENKRKDGEVGKGTRGKRIAGDGPVSPRTIYRGLFPDFNRFTLCATLRCVCPTDNKFEPRLLPASACRQNKGR